MVEGGEQLKMKTIVLMAGLILLAAAGMCGCGDNREYVQMTSDNDDSVNFSPLSETEPDFTPAQEETSPQLTALADTLEEAQEIADLYGIQLDNYSYGVAAYSTDKDIEELITFGQEHNYPTLAPNQKMEINTDTTQ